MVSRKSGAVNNQGMIHVELTHNSGIGRCQTAKLDGEAVVAAAMVVMTLAALRVTLVAVVVVVAVI